MTNIQLRHTEIKEIIKRIIATQQKADRLYNAEDYNSSLYKQHEHNKLQGEIIKDRLTIDGLLHLDEIETR